MPPKAATRNRADEVREDCSGGARRRRRRRHGRLVQLLDKETRGLLATLPTNRDVLFERAAARRGLPRARPHPPVLAKARRACRQQAAAAAAGLAAAARCGCLHGRPAQRRAAHRSRRQPRLERYGLGFDAAGRWTSSVAKSLTSTLVGAALRDGFIKSMDDKVSTYIPQMKGSAYVTT
ncbi:MAG: hypothetical protein U1F25_19460 [Rubrivivax sp.]